jgi:hypothetical protein
MTVLNRANVHNRRLVLAPWFDILARSQGQGNFVNDTVLAAVVGALAATAFNWLQGKARERRERLGVRMLLRQECGRNLATLEAFWERVTSKEYFIRGAGYPMHVEALHYRHRLATQMLPPWGRLMWESQAGLLASALTPAEIERTYSLYQDLDAFTALREQLQAEFDTRAGIRAAKDLDDWSVVRTMQAAGGEFSYVSADADIESRAPGFNQQTFDVWAACEAIHNRARQYGNPVHEDAPTRIRGMVGRLKMPRLQRRVRRIGGLGSVVAEAAEAEKAA